ncbi:MAG: FAD binding domain-containing protein [Pseudomonadaceae bacterium]|nr:FAD binding domain-containing protein [Pseudomonadaceae bacterium]
MTHASDTRPTTLWVNSGQQTLPAHSHNTSLLLFLREHCLSTGTKEGCGSGDCGACTVILRDLKTGNTQSVNSCITPALAARGQQVVTIEGVGSIDAPHPVQSAMVSEHGSQCGFCTPGFVMSMVAEQLSAPTLAERTRADDVRAISGNLCRCTGYRPILTAARQANEVVATSNRPPEQWLPNIDAAVDRDESADGTASYCMPTTEQELQALLKRSLNANTNPLIAGTTDLWLQVSQNYVDFESVVDITRIESLRAIDTTRDALTIGACATHGELLSFFTTSGSDCPAIAEILLRFGSPQIRNRGTIGGNLAGGSPIADWPPLLMALDAHLTLTNSSGMSRQIRVADFFKDYRRTELRTDEYIARIHLPSIDEDAYRTLRAYKISKREEDDISSVMAAFDVRMQGEAVSHCRIAYGGIAATPIRLESLEQSLLGRALTNANIESACEQLRSTIKPLTDVRASADYRRAMSASLLKRALLDARGTPVARLDHPT